MRRVSRVGKFAAVAVFGAAGLMSVQAAVVVDIAAFDLQTQQLGTLLPTSALIQLVNLGADGVFNQIVAGDGGSQWVSGDDTLLSFGIGSSEGHNSDRFDVSDGTGTAGALFRRVDFSSVASGTRLGIRWFPSIPVTGFDPAGSVIVANQTPYGQFTRQGPPLNAEGDPSVIPWILPVDLGFPDSFRFDPLITATQGGNDPNSAGVASFTVVPEPSSVLLFALGAAGASVRRRRAR